MFRKHMAKLYCSLINLQCEATYIREHTYMYITCTWVQEKEKKFCVEEKEKYIEETCCL